jgi:hypothetical protein
LLNVYLIASHLEEKSELQLTNSSCPIEINDLDLIKTVMVKDFYNFPDRSLGESPLAGGTDTEQG